MSRTLVITHRDCFDGHTAAWIYSRFREADAEFVSCRYGDPVPDVKGRDVVIMDFSWPRKEMLEIARSARSLIVLDHHKTAQEALAGLKEEAGDKTDIAVVFDMERSGASLAWDYLVAKPRLDLVNYVEDRDLWRLKLPNAREYMANVYAAPMTFEAWDELDARAMSEMLSRGEAILGYMYQYGTKALAEARLRYPIAPSRAGVILPGPCWTVNLPYMNCSDYLSRLMHEKNVDFVMGYFCRNDGRWQFSLRSRNGFDCSQIAKLFGGGGHREASGFDVAKLSEVFADA